MIKKKHLTLQILYSMLAGAILGFILRTTPETWQLQKYFSDGLFKIGGSLFINLIKMLVIPLVFISLTAGICSLNDIKKLGKIGLKTFGFIILTTFIAIILALFFAYLFQVGKGMNLPLLPSFHPPAVVSLKDFVINIVPSNLFKAMVNNDILQIMVAAILLGVAINLTGEKGQKVADLFNDLNAIIAKAIMIVMRFAPIGVFCLIAIMFAKTGFALILQLINYFLTVVLVLLIHTTLIYGFFLKFLGNLKIKPFFKKLREVILFSFSVSSSNAALPLALETVEEDLGVDNAIAAFVLPLGININKNGTAIMQGIATLFIAHAYHIEIGLIGIIIALFTIMLAAMSSAGAPSTGVFILAIVLKQVGLPLEGIAIILIVDRLLDMLRTPVNLLSNIMIACLIGKSEGRLNSDIYESEEEEE